MALRGPEHASDQATSLVHIDQLLCPVLGVAVDYKGCSQNEVPFVSTLERHCDRLCAKYFIDPLCCPGT